ncbi:MAG: phosphotransferase [Dongiaceae bacterium]
MTSEALRALSRIPLFSGHRFNRLDVERLNSLTNRAYRIIANGESYVLRVPGEGTERHIDRRREHHNMAIAAEIGLAPEIVYFDDESGAMLTRFVADSTALTPGAITDPAILAAAVLALRRLHRCGGQFDGILDPFAKLNEYVANACNAQTIELPMDLAPALAATAGLRRRLADQPRQLVPCHVDPSPENMILRNAGGDRLVVLVDWEYSAMCDPVWDLADFSMEAGLAADQDQALLETYFGSAGGAQLRQLRLFKSICYLVGAGWALMQAAVTGRTDEFMADYAADLAAFRRMAELE